VSTEYGDATSVIDVERLAALRRVATIESTGSSTRIEGAKLSNVEVERLLAGLDIKAFASRDEEEVAGYAGTMETVFAHWQDIALTENHIKQERLILGDLPELSVQVLEQCRKHGRVTVAEVAKVTGSNRNTIKDHLKALTRAGHLVRHGAGRGTWYGLS
jgi:Fic family protein